MSYDALLWLSFGGPEGPDDVRPFLDEPRGDSAADPAARARDQRDLSREPEIHEG